MPHTLFSYLVSISSKETHLKLTRGSKIKLCRSGSFQSVPGYVGAVSPVIVVLKPNLQDMYVNNSLRNLYSSFCPSSWSILALWLFQCWNNENILCKFICLSRGFSKTNGFQGVKVFVFGSLIYYS